MLLICLYEFGDRQPSLLLQVFAPVKNYAFLLPVYESSSRLSPAITMLTPPLMSASLPSY